jgi:phosphate uptake regulator
MHVKDMGSKALDMVRLSIESLKSHDTQLAEKISAKREMK